ncbi:ABC transporter ATP-binding protein [Jejudonia soesokkakensis]|uniref:ABC transporter ATP-binding protein n=1 Tax=Jejudonia soesokkakensis TaxID=1323432 RepID=A0ABW2MY38_9FLAO
MAEGEKNIVLETQNLMVGYYQKKNSFPIASDINFSLTEGQLIGLVGTNGIGKSTLLRTLTRMQPELGGNIVLKGKSLSDYSSVQLATQISVVLTEAFASKNLTVLEMVSLGRQPYTNWIGQLSEADKSAIAEALYITETKALSEKKCYEISDGQLQRVAIARALAQDTPIIILDEPTTHLDLYHRAYILKMLKKLAIEKDKTILFSTHEIDLAIQLADSMIVMTPSKTYFNTPCQLIEEGTFASLFPKETIAFDENTGRFGVNS